MMKSGVRRAGGWLGRSFGMEPGKVAQIFKNGLVLQNPTLVLLLGMCSTLAVTTSLKNAVCMGLSTTAVLLCSNLVISLLRHWIPKQIRIACYVVVVASFVTIVDLLLQAYLPALSESLGIFIPLIVVNCIILARAESFASKNKVLPAAVDGICQGIGYTLVLLVMSAIREFLGSGSLAGYQIFSSEYGALMMALPVGGFLTLGCLIALMQWAQDKAANKEGK